MYLRNLSDYHHNTGRNNRRLGLLRIVLFTIVIIIALIASSLTEAESEPLLLTDSLNTQEAVYFDFGKYDLSNEAIPRPDIKII